MKERKSQEAWDELRRQFPIWSKVCGTVTAVEVYGAHLKLDQMPDVRALLEAPWIGEDPNKSLNYPADYPAVGQKLCLWILGWTDKPGNFFLTQRPPPVGVQIESTSTVPRS